MDQSQQNMYYNTWWNNYPSNNWHMDPPKTGPLNQPPPAHNVSAPSQYPPPPQGMPMAQAIPSGYNLPKPAHTGSSMGMAKSPQVQGMQSAGSVKPVTNMPDKNYPMMPPKSATPPNHSPISTASMPKMPQIPSLIPSVSSKPGCMTQSQPPYQQFQQRLNPQMHFQPQTAQQNLPMHTANQSQANAHNMPPYPQAQIQKVQLHSQNISMSKADPSKGPTPPIPDLISITKPAASQPLPASPVKSDVISQCPVTSAKITQNVISVTKETQKSSSNSELPPVSISPQTVQQLFLDTKQLNIPAPTAKVTPVPMKSEVNKTSTPSDAGSIQKKVEVAEIKVSQEQFTSDKSEKGTTNMGSNLNGVPPKSQLKTSPTVVAKVSESSENKFSTEGSKKLLPSQPTTTPKNVPTPLPKVSPTSGVSLTKTSVTQMTPAVAPQSVTLSKSSQPINKPVVTPPKTIGVQPISQPTPVSVQSSIKSAAVSITPTAMSVSPVPAQSDGQSNVKNVDTFKMDCNLSQPKQVSEVDRSKCENISQKAVSVSPKFVKADNVPAKVDIPLAKNTKIESSPTKISKIESLSAKAPKIESTVKPSKTESSLAKSTKIESAPKKIAREASVSTKASRKVDTSPKMSKAKKSEPKATARSTRMPQTPKTPAEGERKSKRSRNPAYLYQSPAVDYSVRIPKSLTTPQSQERLICFFKNEHVAVRNADNSFYICQLAQNVYRGTRKLKIRWLSPNEEADTCEIFKPDYYDSTDFDCILTSVRLEKVDRSTFRLLPAERERILNILKRALDKEQGIDTSRDDLAEDHPDGLDITLYKDEAQLQKKKVKRSPRGKRAISEDTTDEDSEEMKDLGDDSEDDKEPASVSEHSESEEEVLPPVKVQKTPAKRAARGGRGRVPPKKDEPVKTPTVSTPAVRNKRSAAAAAITESSDPSPPAKVARTLRQPAKTPAKQTKPAPKTTRRTRK